MKKDEIIKEYEAKLLYWLKSLPSYWNYQLDYRDIIKMLEEGTFQKYLNVIKNAHDNIINTYVKNWKVNNA